MWTQPNVDTKLIHMKILLEIRKRTGLSQYDIAGLIGVSRSLISMAEKGLRDLPKDAFEKLMALDRVNSGAETDKRSILPETDDKLLKKLRAHHEKKLGFYLHRATGLQRRLALSLSSYQQFDSKLKTIYGLTEADGKSSKKTAKNGWVEYHEFMSKKGITQKLMSMQKLGIDLEIQQGYAAVHERALLKLDKGEFQIFRS